MSERQTVANVRERLIQNARRSSEQYLDEVSQWKGLVKAKVDDKKLSLPGYIPYIGSKYFNSSSEGRRILTYAMSQNLDGNSNSVKKWADNWYEGDGRLALDRQNLCYEKNNGTEMHPFDTGHVPVLCALLRSLLSKGPVVSISIYDEIAATNLSKFSFRTVRGHTTDEKESHERSWEWFSKEEINALRPDVILCLGNMVFSVISKKLHGWTHVNGHAPLTLKVSFPSLRVINRYYRRQISLKDTRLDDILSTLSNADLDRPVENGSLRRVIERDASYFATMYDRIQEQLRAAPPARMRNR
jgi:hypothetical protein